MDVDELVEINEGTLPPEGPMEDVDSDPALAPDARLSRNQILERSKSWIDERVPYSQTHYHSNRYGKYRQDCSGYVSMCWGLQTSYTTANIMNVAHKISRGELKPGDALWKTR